MTVDDVVERARGALEGRPEILEAYLFGSIARGEQRKLSDVDVAVYLDPSAAPSSPWGADSELTAELMRTLGRNDVDVVVLNRAPPMLYERVLRDGIRLFARDLMATTVREGRAISRYLDWLPTQRMIDATLARGE